MPLVPAKCTQCGANLTVDTSQEAAVCSYCNTPFITEKAITYYNTTNVTNIDTLNAEVVNVESSDSATNLAHTADTLVKFGEWEKAQEVFQKITQLYPYDHRGWYGLLQTYTRDFRLLVTDLQTYQNFVHIYEKLETVVEASSSILQPIKEYLLCIHEEVRKNLNVGIQNESTYWESKLAEEKKQFSTDLPIEIKEGKKAEGRLPKRILWIWNGITIFLILLQAIIFLTDSYSLTIDFGFIHFSQMDSFWDGILFMIVFLLMVQLAVSLLICVIGAVNLLKQMGSKQKKKTSLKFITKSSVVTLCIHFVYWLIAIIVVGSNDPGYFFEYRGQYRLIKTIFFDTKATETEACWIALLLIVLYSIANYALMTIPMFVTEHIGNKKKEAILMNIKHHQEIENIVKKQKELPIKQQQLMFALENLKLRYQNKEN